jgi:hypothetical protein
VHNMTNCDTVKMGKKRGLQGIAKKCAGGPCVDAALALLGACRVFLDR